MAFEAYDAEELSAIKPKDGGERLGKNPIVKIRAEKMHIHMISAISKVETAFSTVFWSYQFRALDQIYGSTDHNGQRKEPLFYPR